MWVMGMILGLFSTSQMIQKKPIICSIFLVLPLSSHKCEFPDYLASCISTLLIILSMED